MNNFISTRSFFNHLDYYISNFESIKKSQRKAERESNNITKPLTSTERIYLKEFNSGFKHVLFVALDEAGLTYKFDTKEQKWDKSEEEFYNLLNFVEKIRKDYNIQAEFAKTKKEKEYFYGCVDGCIYILNFAKEYLGLE